MRCSLVNAGTGDLASDRIHTQLNGANYGRIKGKALKRNAELGEKFVIERGWS